MNKKALILLVITVLTIAGIFVYKASSNKPQIIESEEMMESDTETENETPIEAETVKEEETNTVSETTTEAEVQPAVVETGKTE